MDRARWDRWAPASGVLFVALALSAWFLFIGAPESSFHHSSGSSGTIATRMQAAGEPELGAIAFGGGLVAAAFLALIVAIPAALAFNIAETADAQVAKAICWEERSDGQGSGARSSCWSGERRGTGRDTGRPRTATPTPPSSSSFHGSWSSACS
jgi:hypothetical protein